MADKSLFNLQIEGFSGKLAVLSFKLAEGINYDDSLDVNITYSGNLSESIIGKEAGFSFEFEGKKAFFNGIVTRYSQESSNAASGAPGAILNIKTMKHTMSKVENSVVYYKTDVESIARLLLNDNGILKVKYNLSHYETNFKVQYEESDLKFLRRLLESFNIIEYVRHSESASELIISDNGDFENSDLKLERSRLETDENGSFLLGYGHAPIRSGMEINAFGETFVVCTATHSGNQEAAFGIKSNTEGYVCQITAVSKRLVGKLPNRTDKAVLQASGVMVAKVEGFKGSPAHLDEQGRYVLRMPFDEKNEGTETSCPVHSVQNFMGEDCGIHFPLRKDTPVLIAFENGDIDKPVILGALPDETHESQAVKENSHQNIIKTISGIKFLLDDKTESLDIEAPKNISIKTVEENVSIKAGKDLETEAQKNVSIKAVEEKLSLKAGKDLDIEAQKNVSIKAVEENVSIKAKKELALEGSEKSVIKTKGGVKISLDDSSKSLNIEGTSISIKASSKLVLKGATVEIN